jgi:glycosyltransferase involved in cell wall biosynthesis
MKIWVYTVTYNEEHFVKHFLAAYNEAEKIIVYDNQSTDRTVELLKEDPRVEIRINDSGNEIRDDIYLQIKNNCWKEAAGLADWVNIVDFDEVFTCAILENNTPLFSLDLEFPYRNGYTIIKPYGYSMVSHHAPLGESGHPFNFSKNGVYHWPMEKPCCFRPDKIREINFAPGCHGIDPKGEVKIFNRPEYKLLHFKLWNIDLYLHKIGVCATRLSKINRDHGWGEHYLWPLERHRKSYMEALAASQPLFDIKPTQKIFV